MRRPPGFVATSSSRAPGPPSLGQAVHGAEVGRLAFPQPGAAGRPRRASPCSLGVTLVVGAPRVP